MKKNKAIILITLAVLSSFGMAPEEAFAADASQSVKQMSMFADVSTNNWVYSALEVLSRDNIIDGYNDAKFSGKYRFSRFEISTIVANAQTKLAEAKDEDKMLIMKLQEEYKAELELLAKLGQSQTQVSNQNVAQASTVDKKPTSDIGVPKFGVWARYLYSAYKDPIKNSLTGTQTSATNNVDTQYAYKFNMKDHLSENVWTYATFGLDPAYSTDTPNGTSNYTGAPSLQRSFIKVKTGNFYYFFGRQGCNESDPLDLLGGGMFMSSSRGYDGISTAFVDPDNKNNVFFIGQFNRGLGIAGNTTQIRNVTLGSAKYQLSPDLTLLGAYYKDNGKKPQGDPAIANIASLGFDYTFGKDKEWRILTEYGRNSRAKTALSMEKENGHSLSSLYTGRNTGWDTMLQYGKIDFGKVGTWNVQVDLRRFEPGFNPYSGSEWTGGITSPADVGAGACSDNIKGVGLYFNFIPFKNTYTQLSWYNFAPVAKGNGDGKYRQAVRLMFDYYY